MRSRDGRRLLEGTDVVDLNDCDREPIHVPGTIQPFGVLFALDEEMKVTQVSENVSDHLSWRVDEVLGRPLSEIVDPPGAEEVRSVLRMFTAMTDGRQPGVLRGGSICLRIKSGGWRPAVDGQATVY
jgi:light-regulated signal transduction histidine kinase (bacteriophytochrome)